jgi:23S rRNA pseudouridine1911/1915/1917 synthase
MTRNSIDVANRILYNDNHLIIVNKLAGELVQGDRSNDKTLADSIKDYVKETEAKPGNVFIGIPHRIDRPVSGIVIYAKTSKALSRMSEVFRVKSISKTYWAVTEKLPPSNTGRLVHFIAKNEKQNKSYISETEAILEYTVLGSSDNYHLLEVRLETGRHHQIRAQLAHIGAVIKGDVKYGANRSNPDGSIHLHSRQAIFKHPTKPDEINVIAPCPDDGLWQFFENSQSQ